MKTEDTKLYKYRWLILLAFIVTVGLLYWFIDTRMIVKYIPIALVGLAIGCATFSFAGIFTTVKWKKWIAVILIILGGLFWYKETHNNTDIVYMKEDVLYIKPATNVDQE